MLVTLPDSSEENMRVNMECTCELPYCCIRQAKCVDSFEKANIDLCCTQVLRGSEM